jgi:hypothetical protein
MDSEGSMGETVLPMTSHWMMWAMMSRWTAIRTPARHLPTRAFFLRMSILVNAETKVICQGITGSFGAVHTKGCLDYGTKMVGGVTPGKGGTSRTRTGCRSSTRCRTR